MSRIIVTGPPGSGTTLVAAALAARLRVRFVDGAELFPSSTRAGTDARAVWLHALSLAFAREHALVVASGTLSRGVRDGIREQVPDVVFAELVVHEDAAVPVRRRASWRRARVPAPAAVIEPLAADEPGVRVADDADLESVVDRIATLLAGRG